MSITGTISDSINETIGKSTIAETAMNGAAHLSGEIGHLFTSLAESADSKIHPIVVKSRWQRRRPALIAAMLVVAVGAALYRRRRGVEHPVETAAESAERLRSVTP